MRFVVRTIITALSLLLVTAIIPGITLSGIEPALIAAFFIGILNAVVRPILIVLTLPVSIVTLGLFIFVINAGIFMIAASVLPGFEVSGFWSALLGSIIVSVVSGVAHRLT